MKKSIIAAKPGDLIRPDAFGQNLPGAMYFANENRFDSAFFSQPLTDYATGWRENESLLKTLDFLTPPVQVERKFEFKKAANAEAFLTETDDERAIGADFKRIEYRGTTVIDKTLNHGLTMRVDLDSVGKAGDWRLLYTTRMLQRLMRNAVMRSLALVSAAATNTAKTWDTTAGKSPDDDVRAEVITSGDTRGLPPNRVLYGITAWTKRMLSHGAQVNASGFSSYSKKVEELPDVLGVDEVQICRHRYQSTASAKAQMLNNLVLIYFAEDGLMPDDPSDFKRFWTPCEGGEMFRVYEHQASMKFVDLTVEHYSKAFATGSTGVRELTIS